jgi:acetyl-CoA C-acetyltransferase
VQDVFVVGAGQTPVGRGLKNPVHKLAALAIDRSLDDAGIDPLDIGALYVGNMTSGILSQRTQLGAVIAEQSRLPAIEALSTEAACASGSAAMRLGQMAIASGTHDAVVVCGAEQLTHVDKVAATKALASAADFDLESSRDETFVSLNATLMRLYLEKYGLDADSVAGFSITAHRNAVTNPNALFRKAITPEDYCASRIVAAPLRLYDISPICDGAAAIVLANRAVVGSLGVGKRGLVKVAASSAATMPVALARRNDPLDLVAVREANKRALQQAKIELSQLDLLELHDAYTVMTALCLEAGGFAKPGQAWTLARDDRIARDGDMPISTFGGLKARGHPVGATGVYQLVEAYLQLTDNAGPNQVRGAEFALTQNIGGTASTVINHILQRIQ